MASAHVLIALAHTLIALAHVLIALAQTLIALAHLNSTEKMHRLNVFLYKQRLGLNHDTNPNLDPQKRLNATNFMD